MAPVSDTLLDGSFAAQAGPPHAPDPVTGPTALFWMVCFALNSAAAPSGSVCGLGYEPNWLLRISPVAQLFDGLHMVTTWLMSYITFGGSARMATAATLLGRLAGVNVFEVDRRTRMARQTLSNMKRSAAELNSVVPNDKSSRKRQGGDGLSGQSSEISIPPRDLEKARSITRDLIHNTMTAKMSLDQVLFGSDSNDDQKALGQLQALSAQASEAQFLLWQLIVSEDSAAEKECIRRAVEQYISDVDTVKDWVELLIAARDVTKARSALRQLTKETFFRWFCFALGVLPQALKLFGSSGITGLQICGAAFLFPWIIFESMVGAARILGLENSDANWTLKWDVDPNQHELPGMLAMRIEARFIQVVLRVCKVLSSPWTVFGSPGKGPRHEPRRPGPTERLFRYGAYSFVLACAFILVQITYTFDLFQIEYRGKGTMSAFSFFLIHVWVDDLGSLMDVPPVEVSGLKSAERILRLSCVGFCLSSSPAVPPWSFVAEHWASVETRLLLIFVVVSVVCRLVIFPSLPHAGHHFGRHIVAGLRFAFSCAPTAYYFLVLYEEEGTALLTWAEWLG